MEQGDGFRDTPVLTDAEKAFLLRVARETLGSYLATGVMPQYDVTSTPGLLRDLPAFVTLKRRNGELRGCIGRIVVTEPVIDTVQECAISAATRDYRFPPVASEAELDDLVIEISVLSPFEEIHTADRIQIGYHGLMLRKGMNSGLLLPQVASERNWSREEFLRAICVKAGLPTGAWLDADAHLFAFSAEVFGEE
jgi:AmmeMemoRadiSam system protein A